MSRPTETLLGADARRAVLKGVIAIYDPVRRTLGPEGRNALLYRTFNRGPRITNDGFTVGGVQVPKDPFVRMAAESFYEGCRRTNEKVGDGTTATTTFGGRLYLTVYKMLTKSDGGIIGNGNSGVMAIKRQIEEEAKIVTEAILKAATKVNTLEDLIKIATVSVEDPELGKIIAEMCYKVGVDGFIDVTEGYKGEVETEIIEGMRFAAKVPAKGFVNNPTRFEMIAENSHTIVTNFDLDNVKEVTTLLTPLIQEAKITKIILFAPKFSARVLEALFKTNYQLNKDGVMAKTNLDIFPVATPSLRKDQYQDLAVYCDARFFDKEEGHTLGTFTVRDLGFLDKLVVKDTEAREDAVALGGRGAVVKDQIVEVKGKKKVKRGQETVEVSDVRHETKVTSRVAERIAILKGQLEETREEPQKKLLERRIASMSSASAVIRVGASTQASSLYRKLKIEDCVFACKSAMRAGFVKGGGLCLKEIAETMPEDSILKEALLAPYQQIQNSVDGGIVIGKDIIDPAEVPLYAVIHSAQIVAHLATIEIITIEVEDPIHGEGEFAIARALTELAISDKRHKGLISDNEEEMERDRMKGLNSYEMQVLDEITGGL